MGDSQSGLARTPFFVATCSTFNAVWLDLLHAIANVNSIGLNYTWSNVKLMLRDIVCEK